MNIRWANILYSTIKLSILWYDCKICVFCSYAARAIGDRSVHNRWQQHTKWLNINCVVLYDCFLCCSAFYFKSKLRSCWMSFIFCCCNLFANSISDLSDNSLYVFYMFIIGIENKTTKCGLPYGWIWPHWLYFQFQ